jgi:hypothetical protein
VDCILLTHNKVQWQILITNKLSAMMMMTNIMSMDETASLNYGQQIAYTSSPQVVHEHGEPWWNNMERGKIPESSTSTL